MSVRANETADRRRSSRGTPSCPASGGPFRELASYVGVVEERDRSDAFQESYLELTFMTGI